MKGWHLLGGEKKEFGKIIFVAIMYLINHLADLVLSIILEGRNDYPLYNSKNHPKLQSLTIRLGTEGGGRE